MRRTSVRLTAIAVAIAAAVTGLAGAASASAPSPNHVRTTVSFGGNVASSFLVNDFFAGDCFMDGTNSGQIAEVELFRPDSSGHTSVHWVATIVGTTFTTNRDIWHVTWTFRDAFGTRLGTFGPIDGPDMRTGNFYSVDKSKDGIMDPDFWPLVRTVDWNGSC